MTDKELFGNSEQLNDTISRQEALRIFEEHCYPVRYDHNSIERGMTLTGIVEVLNMTPPAQPDVPDTNVGDTINRQAALDALDRLEYTPGEWATNGLTMCKDAIKALPSAQQEIVACGDCIHWIYHDRRCGYWNHGVKPLDWCCHAERRTNG